MAATVSTAAIHNNARVILALVVVHIFPTHPPPGR